jgi:hypothetical protein
MLSRLDTDELDVVDRSLDILGRAIDRAATTVTTTDSGENQS